MNRPFVVRSILGVFALTVPALVQAGPQFSTAAMLRCSQALNLQPRATGVGGQRDVVIPANRLGHNGLYFFSQDGAYFLRLPPGTRDPFVFAFTTTNIHNGHQRAVVLRGSHYGRDRFRFVVEDGGRDRARATPVVAEVTNDRVAYNALQSFLTAGFTRRKNQVFETYNSIPEASRRTGNGIPALLSFQREIAACTDGTGPQLYAATRTAIRQISVVVTERLHPSGSLHRVIPPQVHRFVGSPSGGAFSYGRSNAVVN
jgi:hypothetical protein